MSVEALILIDQQKAMDGPGREAHWRSLGWPIVHVKHDSTSPVRPGQEGNAFRPSIAPRPGEGVVVKNVQSAFIGTDLASRLDAMGRPPLVICGVLPANSVEPNARVAANLGYSVRLPADACGSVDKRDLTGRLWPAEDVHHLTLAVLDGEYATVTTVDAILVEQGGRRDARRDASP